MSYEPPQGNKIAIRFSGKPYVSPEGGKIRVEFRVSATPPDAETTYIFPQGWSSDEHGELFLRSSYRVLSVEGFLNSTYGQAQVKNNARLVRPSGFNSQGFGTAYLQLGNRYLKLTGFNSLALGKPSLQGGVKYLLPTAIAPRLTFGTVKVVNTRADQFLKPSGIAVPTLTNTHTVYNLRQYVRLSGQGINSVRFGTAYAQGGVKFIYPSGLSTLSTGKPSLINTRADQQVKPTGISSLVVPRPIVSPWYVIAKGFATQVFGTPSIRKHPVAKGWDSSTYGTAWVSRSPRYYTVTIGLMSDFGIARVFDPTQHIGVYGPIAGGIFGDIQTKNVNFFIKPKSIELPSFPGWANIENKNREYIPNGFDSSKFGTLVVRNKAPNLTPESVDFGELGTALIAYRIRELKIKTYDASIFGKAVVVKTPNISPYSIGPLALSQPRIENRERYLETKGYSFQSIGSHKIEMLHRKIKTSGSAFMTIGEPVLTHGIRKLLLQGSSHLRMGINHQVWFRVREVLPVSIFEDQKRSSHMVGGTQHILGEGFDTSRFGTRIVPESQSVYTSNFKSNIFGQVTIANLLQYLKPNGFISLGLSPAERWGHARLHNLRQYVIQTYDVDSQLNPPKWPQWTAIANRNKVLGATGSSMARYGSPQIENNARLLAPGSIHQSGIGTIFISHHTRHAQFEGIEAPYMSGWSAVWNAAKVIAPKGFSSLNIGKPGVVNTRRYFPWIGNLESQVFGDTMISHRIRNIGFEHRYAIAPIYIPIHNVKLYTRYLEIFGDEMSGVGMPALSIHRKIITTRWAHKEYFGDAKLKNLTPELFIRGHNSEAFGQPSIRTQWRDVYAQGDVTTYFPKPSISFRTRTIKAQPFNAGAVGSKLVVKGTSSPPLSLQHIYLGDMSNLDDGTDDNGELITKIKDGFGISPPDNQVSFPKLRQNVLSPIGISSLSFGSVDIVSNGILIENGIKLADEFGTPRIQMKLRGMKVEGIANLIVCGTPSLSPHTIYAVTEAPSQAVKNHPSSGLHAVNSGGGVRKAGEVFGMARVRTHSPYINLRSGISSQVSFGTARIALRRRYITVKGLQAYRMGWQSVGDGTQQLTHRQLVDFLEFGWPTVRRVEIVDPNHYAKVSGSNFARYGSLNISNFIRNVKPTGLNSLAMGNSRGGTLYMPQSLNVGPRRPTIPTGTLMEVFGKTYIGLKVREINIQGFDSLSTGYEPINFEGRMRVNRGQKYVDPKPITTIKVVGFDAFRSSASNVRPGAHFIRPDGNSDQFRKGGF